MMSLQEARTELSGMRNELRRRLEAATPGHWVVSEYLDNGRLGVVAHHAQANGQGLIVIRLHPPEARADLELAALAPRMAKLLLSICEILEKPDAEPGL